MPTCRNVHCNFMRSHNSPEVRHEGLRWDKPEMSAAHRIGQG